MIPFTQTFGQGPRDILGIHCTLGHCGILAPLAEAMGADYSLRCLDLPGHGQSPDWDGHSDIHALSTAMAASVLTQPMDIFGHSFGATVALRLAIEHPERVRSLTLFEPVFFAPAIADHPEKFKSLRATNHSFEEAMKQGDTEQAARLFHRQWGDGRAWDQLPPQSRQYMAARIHFVPLSTAFLENDNAGLLKNNLMAKAIQPTLLLHGTQSVECVPLINQAIARRLPNASCIAIDGAGHMGPLTHAKAVARAMKAHLSSFIDLN